MVTQMRFNRTLMQEIVAFVTLVSLGITGRLVCESMPNVAPVAAIALFAGYFFRAWFIAALVPLAVMTLSDIYIGRTEWPVQVTVYVMLMLPVFARGYLRKRLRFDQRPSRAVTNALTGIAPALLCSVAFFVTTNFACWTIWYERSFAGLMQCYLYALPMFRSTLCGDVFFTLAIFGGYTVACHIVSARARENALDAT